MSDPTANLYAWLGSAPGPTTQLLDQLESIVAEDIRFVANGVTVGTTRAEVMAALRAVPGWESHNTLSAITNAAYVATTYRNDYADGSSSYGCGIMRFDEHGKVAAVYAMADNPRVLGGHHSS